MNRKVELSRELDLLTQCCRWNFVGGDHGPLEPATGVVDWVKFLRLARFHRVEGVAWQALSISNCQPPEAVAEELSGDARAIVASNLHVAAECRKLQSQFSNAHVPHLFLKGLTLGALAYVNPASKSSIDIDLLVRRDELVRSTALLRELGFEVVIPDKGDAAALMRWHHVRKESVWTRPGLNTDVDLHTAVADNPRLLTGIDVNSNPQFVNIGNNIRLPTLSEAELYSYLAVHGASSAWFRLKWISDFAGFLSSLSSAQIRDYHTTARSIGAGRASGQALLLSHALFHSLDRLPALRDQLEADSAIRCLYHQALYQLGATAEPVEPTSKPLGTLRIHLTQFLLQGGLGFKWSEMMRQVRVILP